MENFSMEMRYDVGDCPNYNCSAKGLLLPIICEYTWTPATRAALYLIGLFYSFLGVAIVADIFMCSIEMITSKTTKIKVAIPNTNETEEVEVKVWNGTVANLTLMALGSSAPEILLSIIEIVGNDFQAGQLGPGTIVGSAAFNLLVIIAVCVAVIPDDEGRRINHVKVFFVTAFSSLFAYIWLYIILSVNTKGVVDVWEAILTLMFFPILVIIAYVADRDFCGRKVSVTMSALELGIKTEKERDEAAKATLAQGTLDREAVADFMRELNQFPGITAEDAARLAAARLQETTHHDPGWYRVSAIRSITGGRRVMPTMEERLQDVYDLLKKHAAGQPEEVEGADSPDVVPKVLPVVESNDAIVEFAVSSYAVMESVSTVSIIVCRHGNTQNTVIVRYETIDGTAEASTDYVAQRGELVFAAGEQEKRIDIGIIDDNEWEPDEAFFVKLSVDPEQAGVMLGPKSINQVIIINDDEPGVFEFERPSVLVKESVGVSQVPVVRKNGADGRVTLNWRSRSKSAIDGKDFIGGEGTVTFEHGELNKMIEIPIINDQDVEKDENFELVLYGASAGATLGPTKRTIVTIVNDDDFNSMVSRVVMMTKVNMDSLRVGSDSWQSQFHDAMNVNGGDVENATPFDYLMHFFTFGWKILFALIPPPTILGGWLCFCISLMMIGILTAIVGDLAGIFGCLIGLDDSVTAITLVALGTSLPDLFASKQAATMERYADNSIGNVTGSNSVNVFLGLGLPWVIASIYWAAQDKPFNVPSGSLTFSVALYTIAAVICISLLLLRRYVPVFGGSELGGRVPQKYATAAVLITLWFTYVVLSSLKVYGHILL